MPHLELVQNSWDVENDKFDIWKGDYSLGAIDADKLKNYVEIMLHSYIRTNNGSYNIYKPFRNCQTKDFTDKGYTPDTQFNIKLGKVNLCPDIDADDEFYKIEGKYSNMTFRQSFSVEIMKCHNETDGTCKEDSDIKLFLKQFSYTFYTLQERVNFVDENYNKYPLVTQNSFHSQFVLNLDQYRDNNNFVRINEVETNDNRLNIFANPKDYSFMDFTVNPTWIGFSEAWPVDNVTRDGGVSWKEKESQLILFGSYFFMSEERVVHHRQLQNIMQVLADFGGIQEIFLFLFVVICTFNNEK